MKATSNRPTHNKLYWLITMAIPVVALGLLEVSLRIAGFAQQQPLFIENPAHPDYMLAQPDIIQRYFPEGYSPNVTLEPTFFLKQKPDNGFRVVVQGGSTAAGFPYGLGASVAGMLDHRLRQSLPEHEVEVINVSMSAVNSYFLLDSADEVIATEPDLVVIYAGHNEYLGIFGVGSTFTLFQQPALMRAFMTLRHLAIFDALQTLLVTLQMQPGEAQSASRTLMSKVAKHKAIPINSPMFEAGIAQFENNMLALLDAYKAADIPVVMATLASNLKDQPPFASDSSATDNAQQAFQQALSAMQQGDIAAAKQGFVHAKELDLLRFRAPESINTAIKTLSKREHVFLADVNHAMAARSENGIIGNNLMLEHLHPNLPGYFVLANAVYNTIQTAKLVTPFVLVDANTAWRQRPITPSEEYYGFAQVKTLMSDYPFTATPTQVVLPRPGDWQQRLGRDYFEGKLDWVNMMKRLREGYQRRNDQNMYNKTTALLADALPHDPQMNTWASESLAKQGRTTEAAYYLRRAKRAGLISVKPQKAN